jgi:type II secretory pathway pseudopilin PulG
MNACLGLMVSLLLLPASASPPEDLTRKAMADLRAIGTVMESFAVDSNVYPGPTSGLRPIEELAGQVEPVYIRKLPRTDPWGQPYYVWSTGQQYLVVSGGSDATLDLKYESSKAPDDAVASPGPVAKDTDDLVFVNGQFVRWAKGAQP